MKLISRAKSALLFSIVQTGQTLSTGTYSTNYTETAFQKKKKDDGSSKLAASEEDDVSQTVPTYSTNYTETAFQLYTGIACMGLYFSVV